MQHEKPVNPALATILFVLALGGIGFWIYKATEPNRDAASREVLQQAKAYNEFVKSGGKVDSHGKVVNK